MCNRFLGNIKKRKVGEVLGFDSALFLYERITDSKPDATCNDW